MDISTLTNLITAFRAETRQNSITPDSLGLLLQRIVNVLEQAADASDLREVTQWEDTVGAIGAVLTSISLGTDDRNNIYLNIGSRNTSTGAAYSSVFTVRQATTERAGAMRAQQVTDLNSVRNKMNHVAQLELKVATTASSVSVSLYDKYSDIFNDASKLVATLPLASASQAGIVSAADYKNFSSGISGGATLASAQPYYHISCDAKDNRMVLSFRKELTEKGYVPYLLSYSVKQTRYRVDKTKPRFYGPTRRGWHMFYGPQKIQLAQDGTVMIGHNVGSQQRPVWEYGTETRHLFGDIRTVRKNSVVVGYKVGFGSRTHLITTNHRFRFGIIFAPPLSSSQATLDFSKAVSNVAPFHVLIQRSERMEADNLYLRFAYSI